MTYRDSETKENLRTHKREAERSKRQEEDSSDN